MSFFVTPTYDGMTTLVTIVLSACLRHQGSYQYLLQKFLYAGLVNDINRAQNHRPCKGFTLGLSDFELRLE